MMCSESQRGVGNGSADAVVEDDRVACIALALLDPLDIVLSEKLLIA